MAQQPKTISKAHLFTGRAVDQLRRQLGIIIQEDNGAALGAYPLEGITEGLLAQLRALPKSRLLLLLTGTRAHYAGLDVKGAKTACIAVDNLSLADMLALADPLAETQKMPKATLLPTTPVHGTLMTLAKYAALLPALIIVESDALPADWLRVEASDIASYWAAPPLDIVPITQASLPIEGAEGATLMCFRGRYGTSMHLALIIGNVLSESAPLTRIHSSCVTGDILGSLRCDCGDQLQLAIRQMSENGSGILLYLHQEGRGIGIANKLRAYALQERGVDTYDANLMLGFDEDERDFSMAAAILKKLGITRVRLMTNNPRKIENLTGYGIAVQERVPVIARAGAHNHAYLNAKAKKSGHLF